MQSRSLPVESQFDLSRYDIVRTLGTGGAGTVYLARERETGENIALKKLHQIDHKSVLRFKREFRSLADMHHPNLIRLYDLGRAADAWYLTMEYVDGLSLSDELLSLRAAQPSANDQGSAAAAYVARVVDRFEQLAAGVRAIHAAGMLHRDLKPSNVMVTRDGRVVVLDFGLVRDITENDAVRVTQEGMVTGTPAYMSPEQTRAEPLSEASDWYAFGVMLYEMLSGQLPIRGKDALELLQRKLQDDAAPLDADVALPQPLRALCMELLQRDPEARPRGERVLTLLRDSKPVQTVRLRTLAEELLPHTDVTQALSNGQLFGRDAELARLHEAFSRTREQKTVVALVRGTSGAGKSALVEQFLDAPELAERPEVLVLRSRCYEREAMPFKALDGVIDALVADMSRLDPLTAAHLLPSSVAELSLLFPSFERLPVVSQLLAKRKSCDDAAEARSRAEGALKDLIERMTDDRTLVIWIDDLQWGDLDSAEVIKRWLTELTSVPLLLVFSYRVEESASSPCLKLLLDATASAATGSDAITIELTPLTDDDVRELCRDRLATRSSLPPRLIDRIVQESRGIPFLAQQLIALALAKQAQGEAELDNLSMSELVHRTVALLEPEARKLLTVLAIAGRPVAPALVMTAAGVLRDGRNHIHALQTLRLVRTRAIAGERLIEVYHDRVREGVQAMLTDEERAHEHGRLLQALQRMKSSDPDWLHELALAAGAEQLAAAYHYGLLAAERASASLAFERAAELYARCLRLNPQASDAANLWMKLGVALARCRRGAEAAEAYLHAAENTAADAQAPLLRFAASHLLRSGRFEEGEKLVRRVLEQLGLEVPRSDLGLMAAIAWERARIAMLGYKHMAKRDPEDRARLAREAELYGTLAVDTQLYAGLRAALFQTRSLRLALQSGDAPHIARSLCLAGALVCISGTARAGRQSAEMFARAREISKQVDNDDVAIEIPSGRALSAMFLGRPLEVIEQSDVANRAYLAKTAGGGHGDYYYWFAVNAVRLAALQALGRHHQALEELNIYRSRAHATGNHAAILQVTVTQTISERIADNCANSRARLEVERAALSGGDFGILRLVHMLATMMAACATGEHAWAIAKLEEDWPRYLSSPLHMTAYLAASAHFTHGRLLLNQHVAAGASEDAAALIRPDSSALERLPESAYRDAGLLRLRARCAYLRGDVAQATALFQESTKLLDAAAYLDEPERDRFALGCLVGGAQGAQLRAAAEEALRKLGVREPSEELRGYYPELLRGLRSGSVANAR